MRNRIVNPALVTMTVMNNSKQSNERMNFKYYIKGCFLWMLLSATFISFHGFAQPEDGTTEKTASFEEQLAGQFYQEGAFDKAADLYENVYDKTPSSYVYNQLVNCYIQLKDIKSAERLIQKQIKRSPFQPGYGVDLAHVYQSLGEEEKAKKQYDKLFKEMDVYDFRYVQDFSLALQQRKQVDLAIRAYTESRKQTGKQGVFSAELAALYAQKNDIDKMLDEFLLTLNLSGYQYIEQIQQTLQDIIIQDPSGERGLKVKERFIREVQRSPDNMYYPELLVWLLIQQKEFDAAFIQLKALDKRFKENGVRLMEFGRICGANNQYSTAFQSFKYVIDKGSNTEWYIPAKKELSVLMFRKITEAANNEQAELLELETLLSNTYEELGSREVAYAVGIRLARLKAFYLDKPDEAITILNNFLSPQAGLSLRPFNEVKLELADIQLLIGETWEASLLFSQVEKALKTDTLGQEAKFRNAKLAYYKGEFDWAKAQLDVLKAATSKLIANDALELSLLIGDNMVYDTTGEALMMFARADLWLFQKKIENSLSVLDSLQQQFPESSLADDILYRKAQIAIRKAEYEAAAGHLKELLSMHRTDILADNALFLLGEVYERYIRDNTQAMQFYEELLTEFPGSLFAVEARKRYRALRGDGIQ